MESPAVSGSVRAVDDVSIAIRDAEFFTLLGTVGLRQDDIAANGGRILRARSRPHPVRRRAGRELCHRIGAMREWCSRNYGGVPASAARDNVATVCARAKLRRGETNQRVSRALRLIQLEGFETRWPHQLSGGQLQRVAIARAVVRNRTDPVVYEPLSNLDAKLRIEMRAEIRRLQKTLGITVIYATHDQEEALSMSDCIAVMR